MNQQLQKALEELGNKYLAPFSGRIEEFIAAGGSAAVFKAIKNDKEIALKIYDPKFFEDENGPAELKRIELQKKLIGKPCATLVDTISVGTELDSCFIEMEYLPWKALNEVLLLIPIDAIESLINQLIEAIVFLESFNLVHRDIKPENILVSPDYSKLKLIDLGVVREIDTKEDASDSTDHGHRRPFIATAQYSSPEYLFRLEAPSKDSWRALTIYQVGGVIHDLVLRVPLFHSEVQTGNKFAVAMSVLNKVPVFSKIEPKLMAIAGVAVKCLVKDPKLRLRLVDWSLFNQTEYASAAEKLTRLGEVKLARKRAQDELEQLETSNKTARKKALEAISQLIKTTILTSTAGGYKITSYVQNETSWIVEFSITASETVYLQVSFDWSSSTVANKANVSMQASLEKKIKAEHKCLSIGEFDATSENFEVFNEILLLQIVEILQIASDLDLTKSALLDQDLISHLLEKNSKQ